MRRQRQLRVANNVESTLPIIGLDLNGVLADANRRLVRDVESTWGLKILPEDIKTYDGIYKRLSNYTGKDKDIHVWLRSTVNSPHFILALHPHDGLDYLISGLSDLPVEPRVITGHSQNELTVKATEEWCHNHKIPWAVNFVREKDGWCRQTKSKWLVEDNPYHILTVSDNGQDVIVYNQPYNQNIFPTDGSTGGKITRVKSLLDILTVVTRDLKHEMLSGQRTPLG